MFFYSCSWAISVEKFLMFSSKVISEEFVLRSFKAWNKFSSSIRLSISLKNLVGTLESFLGEILRMHGLQW